jgi:hypothetical protein
MPERSFDFQEEYDDYIQNTPLEARFDYLTIQTIVSEGFEKHKAYGMSFEEYRIQRARMMDYDETEKKRLTYYLPKYNARIASDLAFRNKVSYHRFTILMIELGLIHLQVDYHDEYEAVRDGRDRLFSGIDSIGGEHRYMQLEKQTIDLGTCNNARTGKKHFSPNVPEWLYNATFEISNYLNMTSSDLVFLSLCIGITNCLPENEIPKKVYENAKDVVSAFDVEIKAYGKRISDLLVI